MMARGNESHIRNQAAAAGIYPELVGQTNGISREETLAVDAWSAVSLMPITVEMTDHPRGKEENAPRLLDDAGGEVESLRHEWPDGFSKPSATRLECSDIASRAGHCAFRRDPCCCVPVLLANPP